MFQWVFVPSSCYNKITTDNTITEICSLLCWRLEVHDQYANVVSRGPSSRSQTSLYILTWQEGPLGGNWSPQEFKGLNLFTLEFDSKPVKFHRERFNSCSFKLLRSISSQKAPYNLNFPHTISPNLHYCKNYTTSQQSTSAVIITTLSAKPSVPGWNLSPYCSFSPRFSRLLCRN